MISNVMSIDYSDEISLYSMNQNLSNLYLRYKIL
nr:MAG TPA: hypothetical protein [Caudoviricetes sp.]